MAGRIRSIKPEVLEDELAASLSDTAWRIWVSSWVLADDFGNFRAGARYIASQVWQDTNRCFDAVLGLEELRTKTTPLSPEPMITTYIVRGQRYAHLKGFQRHQRQDNASTKKRLPAPEENDAQWFPEVDLVFAAKRSKPPRVFASRGEIVESAALTSYLLSPTAYHRPPLAATDADASTSASRAAAPPVSILELASLTEPERAVHTAIVGDESLRPIVRAPVKLSADLVRVAPGIDVPGEVRKAGAWLRANPTKRKSNGAKFLLAWLTREQDARGGRTVPASRTPGFQPGSTGRALPAGEWQDDDVGDLPTTEAAAKHAEAALRAAGGPSR